MRYRYALFLFFCLLPWESYARDSYVQVAPTLFTRANQTYLYLHFKNQEGWHTYWENPGDAGQPFEFKLLYGEKKKSLLPLEWPIPQKFTESGDIITYGYQGEYGFFFKLPAELLQGEEVLTTLEMIWLVCKDICVPGAKKLTLTFSGGKLRESAYSLREKAAHSWELLPKKTNHEHVFKIKAYRDLEKPALHFYLDSPLLPENKSLDFLTRPYAHELFYFSHEAREKRKGRDVLHYRLRWRGQFKQPPQPLPDNGIFPAPISFKFLFYNAEEKRYETTVISMDRFLPVQAVQKKSPQSTSSSFSLWVLLMAFLGGLILNVMPCVLPVISLKLFSIVQETGVARSQIIKHNLSYSAGVLASFLGLGLTVYLFKVSGESIGWGQQLQSPLFVMVMVVILFLLTLNLLGYFEFKTPGGKFLGNIQTKNHGWGNFFSGILTTVLATPCSAPFLGTATTYAFSAASTGPGITLAVFLCIALGLTFPFLMIALFPQTVSFLPRPGMWMNKVKMFLGLTLLLTTLWLSSVFLELSSASAFFNLCYGLFFIFALFFVKIQVSKRRIFLALALLGGMYFLYQAYTSFSHPQKIAVEKVPWSPKVMEQMVLQKQKAFIEFGAAWCITCKVNEKLIIQSKSFQNYLRENNIALIYGDWTQKDPQITQWLEKHNKVGVPAYFYLTKDGILKELGETISLQKLKKVSN